MGVDGRLAFPGVTEMANGKTEYRLAFGADIYLDAANNLRARIADIIERDDFGSLMLLFSSAGGNTDNSLALYKFLAQLPVPVQMHGMGHIGSAAVPVFLAGSKRTCSPFARFFFHEYIWNFDGDRTLYQIDEATDRLKSDIEFARKIMRARTKLPDKYLQTLDGQADPAIIEPVDAKKYGLVEDILELAKTGADGMKVAVWTT
jgi:ATP-dependent protease ClpP protease subunit